MNENYDATQKLINAKNKEVNKKLHQKGVKSNPTRKTRNKKK
jgi:hypothetical protein